MATAKAQVEAEAEADVSYSLSCIWQQSALLPVIDNYACEYWKIFSFTPPLHVVVKKTPLFYIALRCKQC